MNNPHALPAASAHPRQVTVTANARIHLGFVDLTRRRARQFGSLGLALEGPQTRVVAKDSTQDNVGDIALRAKASLIADAMQLTLPPSLELTQSIPSHIGFGSGTQLGLALAAAIAAWHGRRLPATELARHAGRGRRSGIGIATFESGGFVVDAGRAAHTQTPPVISRCDWPDDWRVLLIFDDNDQGLSGAKENTAFETLPGMSIAVANELAYLTLMVLLPALAEGDFSAFTRAVGRIQEANGAHFSTAQNGCYSSPRVAEVLEYLKVMGLKGHGQSSWGPTGFLFCDSEANALNLVCDLQQRFGHIAGLRFSVMRGCNAGASIEECAALSPQMPESAGPFGTPGEPQHIQI